MNTRRQHELLDELTDLRQRLDALIDEVRGSAADPPAPPGRAPARPPATGGLLSAFDLSDDLRAVYLELLRHDALTMAEITELPALANFDGIDILVRTLARQGQVERFAAADTVKYRPRLGQRAHRQLPDRLWQNLERP